jgi:hypothetical protein
MDSQSQITNSELSGKEAYEARKKELQIRKQEIEEKTNHKSCDVVKKYIIYAVLIAVMLSLVYLVYILIINNSSNNVDQSYAVPDMGNSHIAIGSAHEPYNSNPPTSGPHYDEPARPGFRDENIADEHLVHSLEHGLVWIAYGPTMSKEVKDVLKKLGDSMVVITSREENDTDIALVAWTRVDKFDLSVDGVVSDEEKQRIKDFILRYRNRGPEKIPPGQHGGI